MESNVPIRALPQEVAGQIRSSSVVTNLNGVILELIKNSLDARASTITVMVDFQKGTCTVEDNGLGIPPDEFHENGGIGKLHHTSKFYTPSEVYGRKGAFISSLISMALVTITSRNKSFQQTNSIIFRHSKLISRLCPSPIQHDILHPQHGTRVTVNDLFSNLPVRAKRRIQDLRRNEDIDREWDDLKRAMTGLLLAFQKPVQVSVVDASRSRKLVFRGKARTLLGLQRIIKNEDQYSFDLERVRSILGNAGYITPSEYSSWVTASARSSDITVDAAISLTPSPTKQVQFISYGISPVYSLGGADLLFTEINQCFASSNFGVEDSPAGASGGIERMTLGGTKLLDGSFSKKIKVRSKGVNKWPMFYVRIETNRVNDTYNRDREFSNPKIAIQKIIGVIRALFLQFLEQYHFSYQQPQHKKRCRQESPTVSENIHYEQSRAKRLHHERSCSQIVTSPLRKSTSLPAEICPLSAKSLPSGNFGTWSRVKSGKRDIYDDICAGLPRGKSQPANGIDTTGGILPSRPSSTSSAPESIGDNDTKIAPDISDTQEAARVNSIHEHNMPNYMQTLLDEVTTWTDPLTKRTIYVNKRTGQTVPRSLKCIKQISGPSPTRQTTTDTQRQARRETSHWFTSFLKTWENPTFSLPELPIRSTTSQVGCTEKFYPSATINTHCLGYGGLQGNGLEGLRSRPGSRLTKCILKKAKVIAQVDHKFILLRTFFLRKEQQDEEILVLVDQHAADERCRVEELFAGLCGLSPLHVVDTVTLPTPINFRISTQEAKLLETRSGYFAAWGCLYEVLREAEGNYSLVLRSLPTLIAERCRVEPQLAIDMLRSEIWDQTDISKASVKSVLYGAKDTGQGSAKKKCGMNEPCHYWLERIGSCPKKMVDLIISRACRSAIMFNDELSIAECQNLVSRLAKCAFPFQCAHGRPSMVPILGLGPIELSPPLNPINTSQLGVQPAEPCSDFVTAFNRWQNGFPLS
ncbi:DNA mismatch repair protein [Microsporum audouinii]